MELGVLGPLQVRQYGLPVAIPGAKPRAILTMLGLHGGSVVSADTLVALLWGDDPPRTATKALQTHISSLRRALGDGFVLTEGTGWTLSTTEIDAIRYRSAAKLGRKALAANDPTRAVTLFDQALALWRGIPELPDSSRGSSEKTRWLEGHAALVEDRADALLATGRAAEIVGELESAIAEAPLRERRWGHLMLALYRAGRQGEALGAYRRARSLLAEELGVDPGPELRRLEVAIVAQDAALEVPQSQQLSTVTRAVTFLLTDIEGSTAAWEADADAMAVALARHDEIVEQVVTSRGGRLIKTRGEGDATFSVFDRPSAAAAAAIELQDAIGHEDWRLAHPMRIRVALHTGEVEFRDGDYFGRAVNRAARLRSLATGGQILCSGATAELVIDSLPDDVVLADLGTRRLRNLPRPEHVFELHMETADHPDPPTVEAPMVRPALPAVLVGPGPFVGRGHELERLVSAWQSTLAAGTRAVLIAGEPGVGKTRLAGEWSRHAYEQNAVVLYGRSDEDLGAPYQPFAEALRSLVSCVDSDGLRSVRGIESLLPLVPGLSDALPDVSVPPRADPDTERYAMFDAVVALLGTASATAPVVLILDDLHWAAKPTLLLLRHLLRFGDEARVQIIGTYRSTDLDRSHPLAAMLADLHRDGTATRLQLSGLEEGDVTAYVAEVGYHDEELGRALATVTGGNPFFLIEALRHVEESGGRWDPSTLPQGVREAVSRRLSRLTAETNKALAAGAVVGSRFALTLVEQVMGEDLVDAFDEAAKAGIVIEEPGGRYRFNHALVRQSLLAELPSVRRMRLHQRIAGTLEGEAGADDELLAELAYHYFECAWAGNAVKAVEYCRRAADQAMSRVAYEGAADLYDRALHALEELDDELPDRDALQAELLIAHCEALLAAGDVTSAKDAVTPLRATAGDSGRLGAWGICFDGELSMLTDPERLDDIESAVNVAAERLAALDDAAGEAKAHTVRAGCLARLGRIGDCETALDQALTAARRARDHSRVNAVLAGAPLAALWGPNPVPRAGGRCLDVVRLLRITTGSPLVEATSTRCQAVLDALRGRAAEGRRLIESARRTLTELGLRHALLEVDQFAGIIELVADDAAAAEPYLRRAYEGFHRMGLDIDTADTAALLGRACLALDRADEADELCSVSERLAGHGSKASIAWRSVRAQLLAHAGVHDRAKEFAEEAVSLAAATDALVDHGDACLALATVLRLAGDTAGMRAAAEQAVTLYDQKGAAALSERGRKLLGASSEPTTPDTQTSGNEPENACVRVIRRLAAAADCGAWDEYQSLYATDVAVESRRKVVGFTRDDLVGRDWPDLARRVAESDTVRHRLNTIAVRGERLALCRLRIGGADVRPDAPHEDVLELYALDGEGRIARRVWFDAEDLDAALAELDNLYGQQERPPQRSPLENSATRGSRRFCELFAEREWDEMRRRLADDVCVDDRRRGLHRVGRDRETEVANLRELAALGVIQISATPLTLRGDRLCLNHLLFQGRDTRPEAFATETVTLTEVDNDGLIVALIAFDHDDFDAAIAELDARYLVGEGAAFAQTWSAVAHFTAAFNRHEYDATDCPSIDHRRLTRYTSEDSTVADRPKKALPLDLRTYIEEVHRISDGGVVITSRSYGVAQEGFEAEWRVINILLIKDGQLKRYELFDETDVDAALARFDEISRPAAPRLETAATRLYERFKACFAVRDWHAITDMLAENLSSDDRRRIVNTGLRQGRDALLTELKALPDVGAKDVTSEVIATRGEHLVLSRVQSAQGPGGFHVDALDILELGPDERVVARIVFDLEDIDAAFEELDTRYMSREASPYARTWAVIVRGYAGLNRNELAPTTPDWLNVDHRRLAPVTAGRLGAYIRTSQVETPDIDIHIAAVHRISELGAVVTRTVSGTSREGFYAEWREIDLVTVEGELVSRCEIFDEADLDVALAEFDELNQSEPRLQNAASESAKRLRTCFTRRDWEAARELLAADVTIDDRRQVVNNPLLRGRDDGIAHWRVMADLGVDRVSSQDIAIRGERIALSRTHYLGSDDFRADVIDIVETDAEGRIIAYVTFDAADLDAAFEELETRYVAGKAAPYALIWSVVAGVFASLARHEIPPSTADWSTTDHRRGSPLADSDLREVTAALWDLTPDLHNYIETVHRLGDKGAIVTQVSRGTTAEGFPAEWRMLNLITVDGPLVSGCELFDEDDLDAAVSRFQEISHQAPDLENAASRANLRFLAHFAAGDWDAIAELIADSYSYDDRRRIVNSGVRHGRTHAMEDVRAAVDLGLWRSLSAATVATRGKRLALMRFHASGHDPEAIQFDVFQIIEVDVNGQFTAVVVFDVSDIDSALEELESRYLAGEASPHAPTWTVIAGAYATVLRHELPPTTPDWVNVDHRRVTSFAPNELEPFLKATWDVLDPDINIYIEAVHRLTDIGAVVTRVIKGTSREGFAAEWREIGLSTVDGDQINRSELFDETDLEVALAQFETLNQPAVLKNTATEGIDRYCAAFGARDWAAMAETLADDVITDDRRRVVNAGVRHGRDVQLADSRAAAEVGGGQYVASTVIATRGERLVLSHVRTINSNTPLGEIGTRMLGVAEVNADNRITLMMAFDDDDLAAAFQELDDRYLAGEASDYAQTWSAIVESFAAVNRGEVPRVAPGCINLDHRRAVAFAPGELGSYTLATQTDSPDLKTYIGAVHRLDARGAVVSYVAKGTSAKGFQAEWRGVSLSTVGGGLVNRVEWFDETDLESALAHFDELVRRTTQLQNAATRADDRFDACFHARDWDAMAAMLTDDTYTDDRRRAVNGGRQHGVSAEIENMRTAAGLGVAEAKTVPIAVRGQRLALSRTRFTGRDRGPGAFRSDLLGIVEVDDDQRIVARVIFDTENFDAALEELDARYLAGEASQYAHTWTTITHAFAVANTRRFPEITADFVDVDHRQGRRLAAGEIRPYMDATWDVAPDASIYIQAVHRLTNLGAVVTHAAVGTTPQGFQAEWQELSLSVIDGHLIKRCELFDPADLDAALARFDELTRPVSRPVNAAYQMVEDLWTCFAKRDWSAIGELLAADVRAEDRRRIVNDGLRQGREAFVANMRAVADVGTGDVTSTVVATRGRRLVLARVRSERFHNDVLNLVELDAAQQLITSTVVFDVDDLDVAFIELDARYGAGEAAAHGRMWTVLANAIDAFNRRMLPTTTPDWVNTDHRSGTSIAPGQLFPYVRTSWELAPDISNYIEVVHRLNDSGAVFTRVATGSSRDGFNAEWRVITLATFDGDLLSRVELFDETDLDAALARFEELSSPVPVVTNAATKLDQRSLTGPENAATRALADLWVCFDAQDSDAVQGAMAENFTSYDRRQVVNAGVRRGRAIHIENMRSVGEVGFRNAGSPAIATRGERLALCLSRFTASEGPRDEIVAEALMIIETDVENRLVSSTVFDLDALNEAFAELDAKYSAGEASPHAQTWSVVTRAYAALNRQEQSERDWIYTDHRRGTPFASTSSAASAHPDVWDVTPDLNAHIEVVHRLTDGAVLVTSVVAGTSHDSFEAEWRFIQLLTVAGGSIERCELFDETDIDAARARFDELRTCPTYPDNAAVRLRARVADAYNRRATETFTAGAVGSYEDRRRGLRDEGITDAKYALAVLSETPASWKLSLEPVAVRGDRLALTREAFRDTNDPTLPITIELIVLTDVADDQADLHTIFFDPDDVDAAFLELDRRFAVGEAAPYSRTWSAIAESYAMVNRHETPNTTPAWVDHRLVPTIEAADLIANLRAAWEIAPDIRFRIATVRRLTKLGAVIDHFVEGHSDKGFPFDYRELALVTVDGDRANRFEMFDSDNLDAAFARLDELSQAPPIENAATRFWTVVVDAFNRRDVETVLNLLSDDGCQEDRRTGLRAAFKGTERRRAVEAMFTTAPPSWRIEVEPIAARGSLLALMRQRYRDSASNDGQIVVELLSVTEMHDSTVVHDTVDFDTDDIASAMQELESRYFAGEAAPYTHTWSRVIRTYDAFNRHELSPTTEGWVNIDHRPIIASAPGDVHAYVRESWEVASDISTRIEAVHRLSGIGAVFTHAESGTSREGFVAEWREVTLLTFDGDAIMRCEIFDEDDLDTALARFDELSQAPLRLENAATKTWNRAVNAFNSRDQSAFLALVASSGRVDDRRKGLTAVHFGVERARAAQAVFEVPEGWRTDIEAVAIRGSRLSLIHQTYRDIADKERPITVELLSVLVVDDDGLVTEIVNFDLDDLDAAFEELETRYLAGEAAAHARTWSAIARSYTVFNRRELFRTTPDWVNIDHRRGGTAFAPGEQSALIHATWEVVRKIHVYPEVIHRLNTLGAVFTQTVQATSQEGFDGEWREITLLTVEGDAISRCEVFDEADLDAALTRFDDLSRPAHRLENAATLTRTQLISAFNNRGLDVIRPLITPDGRYDDRRKGLRSEGLLLQEFVPSMISEAPDSWRWTAEPVAIRGHRLVLCRDWFRDTDAPGQPITVEDLSITEVTEGGLVCHSVIFDSDDLDAAMRELDARWIASGEVTHREILEAHRTNIEMTNRHEWDALTAVCAGATYINHRQLGSNSADYITSIRTLTSLAPDLWIETAEVLDHSTLGVACHVVVKGTSSDGFAIEVPFVLINLWGGDRVTHIEAFDPEDRDWAVARFEELNASS
ncbi:BTAD domain-containing putative transcriptional regulator [Mycolicibacterium sp. XJ1904]